MIKLALRCWKKLMLYVLKEICHQRSKWLGSWFLKGWNWSFHHLVYFQVWKHCPRSMIKCSRDFSHWRNFGLKKFLTQSFPWIGLIQNWIKNRKMLLNVSAKGKMLCHLSFLVLLVQAKVKRYVRLHFYYFIFRKHHAQWISFLTLFF